jgi:hypothetical protein
MSYQLQLLRLFRYMTHDTPAIMAGRELHKR